MKKYAFLLCGLPIIAQANDSTGFVSTGGVEYIKNANIAMQSEDLFVSQHKIRVAYQYKNLTDKTLTENVLFPLPIINSDTIDSDFADTAGLVESFKIIANGKSIKPNIHVRAWLYPKQADGYFTEQGQDITEILKGCGLAEQELSVLWTNRAELENVEKKIISCKDDRLTPFKLQEDGNLSWGSQIIYSWQQTFNANSITHIQHEYKPLLGGSVEIKQLEPNSSLYKNYCANQEFYNAVISPKKKYQQYEELSYILTTGANWAKPIANFSLTVERNVGDLVSFCWDGDVKKIFDNGKVVRFQALKKDFVPTKDLDILFVPHN